MLKGKKTYVTAVLAVATAVGAYLTGDIQLAEAIQISVTAILAGFLRAGITTETK